MWSKSAEDSVSDILYNKNHCEWTQINSSHLSWCTPERRKMCQHTDVESIMFFN